MKSVPVVFTRKDKDVTVAFNYQLQVMSIMQFGNITFLLPLCKSSILQMCKLNCFILYRIVKFYTFFNAYIGDIMRIINMQISIHLCDRHKLVHIFFAKIFTYFPTIVVILPNHSCNSYWPTGYPTSYIMLLYLVLVLFII